tara:strand:+ start:247 stop:516 length:270 start_codon:yes stop_codon:yes gene_type:complete
MSLLNDITRELKGDGYPDLVSYENSTEYIFEVELETAYEDNFVDDLEDVLLFLGYSPVEDFDGMVINKIGNSTYEGFDLFQLELYKDNY